MKYPVSTIVILGLYVNWFRIIYQRNTSIQSLGKNSFFNKSLKYRYSYKKGNKCLNIFCLTKIGFLFFLFEENSCSLKWQGSEGGGGISTKNDNF